MFMHLILIMVEGNAIESHTNIINNNHPNHSEPSIADQVEIIYPNLQQSLTINQKNRLNKDPKFLSEQVEVFSKKNQTFKSVPESFDVENSDGKPLKFVSSRPLFVYRNEARKKQQKQQQQQQNYGYGFGYTNLYNYPPYPYPFSYYTNHGVFHYYPYGQ